MASTANPKIKRALISVSNKSGLVDFCSELVNNFQIEIISTGGTLKTLKDADIPAIDISDFTGFPEMMDGRVKTLHPKVHGGILARRDIDQEVMSVNGKRTLLLPVGGAFHSPLMQPAKSKLEIAIENIDIGGPTMVRSAAKNNKYVGVIVDPGDYRKVLSELNEQKGSLNLETRKSLAAKAFTHTGKYDTAISDYLNNTTQESELPENLFGEYTKKEEMRYGENPHQKAKFYNDGSNRKGLITSHQIQGKELSYNNINDTNAAFELVSEFDDKKDFAVAIIKHANPCGVATGSSLIEAYSKALNCDSVSAFGGIIALNKGLDKETAKKISEIFTEVIIAPSISEDAKIILASKKNLRVLITGGLADPNLPGIMMKSVSGGFLAQTKDNIIIEERELKIASSRKPSEQEMSDLLFAFKVAKHVKSNAIVYAKNGATVGIGAGQMNRLDSSRIAARKSEDAAKALGFERPLAIGSVVASDAFFPFADGLMAAADAGVTAIIQPGGSIRDDEVIASCK